jgi:hypothetical protein
MATTQANYRRVSKSTIKQRHEVDWENDDEIVDFVKSRWENKDYYKRGLERKWLDVVASYEGMTQHNYDEVSRRLISDSKIPPWRVKLTINLLLPYIRTAAAKHLRNRPSWDVIPATTDSKDYDIASAGKKTLRGYWYNQGLNYKFIDILLWLGITGNAFAGILWNPDSGPQMELEWKDFINQEVLMKVLKLAQYDRNQDPEALKLVILDAQDKFTKFIQANNGNLLPLGENDIYIPTPFDVLCPFSYNFYEIPWLIVSTLRNISYYVDLGYDPGDFSPPTEKEARFIFYAKRIDNLQNIGSTQDEYVEVNEQDVLELQLWLPRSRQFQKGYSCVIAGGKVIHKGPNPYKHNRIPFVHFGTERTPGKVWHFSSAEHALPILRQYQKTKSQITEIKNLMGKPKWLVSRSSNIKKTAITSEPGEVIEYTGSIVPVAWSPPPVPRYMFDLMAYDRRDMDEIMAQRDATKGSNPAGVRSNSALQTLIGADEGQLAIVGLNLDTGFSLMGRLVLSNYAQFVKEDRLVTYVGDRNRYESIALKQGSLEGPNARLIGADYFNVRVNQYSQFGLTREGQLQFLNTLLQYNIYTPKDRPKILEFIQMGYFEDQVDEYKKDRANANKENLIMASGQPIGIETADRDEIHIEEHYDYMKGDDYRQYNPQIKAIYIQHVAAHKFAFVSKLLEMQVLTIPARIQLAKQYNLPLELVFAPMGENNGRGKSGNSSSNGSGSSNGTGQEAAASRI